MDLVRKDIRPSQILTRRAIENAIASVAATGGSTNGVLHLLAIARELGIPLSIDDFDAILERTPRDRRPEAVGHVRRDRPLRRPAGSGSSPRELAQRDLIDADALTVDGRTLGEIADAAEETPGPAGRRLDREAAQAPRRPRDPARQPRAGRVCDQARRSRPDASPRPGQGLRLGARLLRRGEGRRDRAGRRGRHPLRGARRRTGDAGDARRSRRRSSARGSRTRSRSSPTGASRARRTGSWSGTSRPRRSSGGPIAALQTGDMVVDRRRRQRELDVELSDDEIAARLARLAAAEAALRRAGVFAKYAALVSSASEGAVTRPPPPQSAVGAHERQEAAKIHAGGAGGTSQGAP